MHQYFVVGDFNCPVCNNCVGFDQLLGDYLPVDAHYVSEFNVRCTNGHETQFQVTANAFGATGTFGDSDKPAQMAVRRRTLRPFMGTNLQNLLFEEAQDGLRRLVEDSAHKPDSMLHRMYLIQCVANFEVFVSDTIQGLVVRNPDVRLAIINSLNDLKDQKAKLSEFAATPHMVTNILLENLRRTSFQNVEELSRYLKPALDLDVLPAGADRGFLEQMFTARHDCVHRNGRTKLGAPIQDPLPQLERLLDLLHEISLKINQRVSVLDWEAAKSRVLAMLSRYRELIATLPRTPDDTALANIVQLEPPALTELEMRFQNPEQADRNQESMELWDEVVKFDESTTSNLREIVEKAGPVPDVWFQGLTLARDISTEMLRAVGSAINRQK